MMFDSPAYHNVFWAPAGTTIQDRVLYAGWYWWDEVGLLGGGPFPTDQLANEDMTKYMEKLYEQLKAEGAIG